MVYNIDTIPAKIYFKIHETKNLKLLSDEDITEKKLLEIWTEIVQKDEERTSDKRVKRIFELNKKVQELSTKYNTLKNALNVLVLSNDEEVLKILDRYSYPISSDDYFSDIERTKNNIEIIHNKIEKYKSDLKALTQTEEKNKNDTTFEDALLGYYTILEYAFKDANTITLLEFRGLEKQVKSKIEALEEINEKK